MKSRRNFIARTGMATAAMLVLKPFKGLASSSIARKWGFGNSNRLVVLHTGSNPRYNSYAEETIASLKSSNHNMLLLKNESSAETNRNYETIYKDNVKTGIIKVKTGDTAKEINTLAAFLKKERNCQLVICLSPLGYKNKNGLDDITLAEKSTDIDIIIGNHASNHTPFAMVARNSNRAEVIIHHATDNGFGLGNIEVEFDEHSNTKRSLAINNLLTRLS